MDAYYLKSIDPLREYLEGNAVYTLEADIKQHERYFGVKAHRRTTFDLAREEDEKVVIIKTVEHDAVPLRRRGSMPLGDNYRQVLIVLVSEKVFKIVEVGQFEFI